MGRGSSRIERGWRPAPQGRALLVAAAIAAGSGAGHAVAADPAWQVHRSGRSDEAFVDTGSSRLAVRCDPAPAPTVTIAYTAPQGVRLAETSYGVWSWNIAVASFGAKEGESGGLYLFDETERGKRFVYSVAADASFRDGQSGVPLGPLDDVMHLLEMLRRGRVAEISSAEERDENTPPVFRDVLPLTGSSKAIERALTPGGCAQMIAEAWADLEATY